MAASKTLILLKGIAGFAATSLATVGGFQVGHKLKTSNALSLEQNDETTLYVENEPEEYIERVNDLGIPDGCSDTCELTAEQLRNLKFEQRSSTSIAYDGLNNEDTFELTVEEVSEDTENYPWGKKYTLKAKTTAEGTIRIRNLKGDEIVLGGEKGVEIREKEEGGWLEKVPEEINNLGIPTRCEDVQDEEPTTKTCDLTREQLQRLKFEPKDDETSISVEGKNEGNIVTLKIEASEDSTNYPNNKKYTLTSTSGTVTIKGVKDGDIVLEGEKGVDFREKSTGDQLETVENSLGIPKWCTEESECQLTEEQLQRLKFEAGDESSIEIDGLNDNEKVELKVETVTDLTNYPKGKKYTLKTTTASGDVTIKGTKDGDIVLGESGIVIRETSSGGKLEKAPEEVDELGIPKRCATETPCELTKKQLERLRFETKGNKEIRVEGLGDGNKVELTVETVTDSINYPKGKKFTLKSTDGTVTIKNVKDGDIEIGKEGVLIRETTKGRKLEEALEEVDKLGIPKEGCDTECQLTKEQLERFKFEGKTSSPITVGGLEKGNKVTLKVEDPNDPTNYPKGKKYTLRSTAGTVTIKGVKGGDIVLENDVVIREKGSGGLLEKAPEEFDELGIPKSCNGTCDLTKEQLRKIKFEPKNKNTSVWISGLKNSDRVDLKVEEVRGDSDNYPKEKKYSFKANKEGVVINGTKDGDIVLEKDKWVDFREKQNGRQLETVEDALGIPKSCKASQAKKNNPQTCELNADQLKNIKFKAFGGKNAYATASGLYVGEKLKLTISWKEGGTYPGNIKYSFDNTDRRDEHIKITRSGQVGQSVTIDKQKESRFKNEGGQLEQVEAKTKSEVKTEEANEILEKLGLGKLWLSSGDFNSIYSTWHKKKTVDFWESNETDLKKIQFKEFNGGAEIVDGLSRTGKKITVYFEWDSAINKFPKNMKFTFENAAISPDIALKKGKNSVKIWKKERTNPNNEKNIFKVEQQEDKWYLVRSSN